MEVSYQLFVDGEQGLEMMEEATKERPFQFITGFGVALDAFEQQVIDLEKGANFNFSIPQDQAYAEREAGQIKPFSCLKFKIELLGIEK